MNPLLNKEPIYFPIEKPIYEVGPGLKLFGVDLGQGEHDKKLFQIAEGFPEQRKNKIDARKENLKKYITSFQLETPVNQHICEFMVNKLAADYPTAFIWSHLKKSLICHHTQEQIFFDENWNLIQFITPHNFQPAVSDALDALLLQVPEDIAILKRKPDGDDYLAYLNLCSPSHWAASDKIGKNFYKVHEPVASAEKLLKAAPHFVDAMIKRGPFVRFVWSFVTDTRLNHHPEAPPQWDAKLWKGRSFDSAKANPFYFRVERQTVWGFPSLEASLFAIRISFLTGESIKNNPTQRDLLIGALLSMTPESRVYKGVADCFDELIDYLRS
jgi:dimethylamine monooxygenase subunit A